MPPSPQSSKNEKYIWIKEGWMVAMHSDHCGYTRAEGSRTGHTVLGVGLPYEPKPQFARLLGPTFRDVSIPSVCFWARDIMALMGLKFPVPVT